MTTKARVEAAIQLFRSLGNFKMVIDIADAELFVKLLEEKEARHGR